MNLKHGKEKAFTLIELLVVIAIVGILSSVIYTNITGLRDRARITAGIRFDSSTLHSIGDQLVGEWLFDTNASPTPDTSGSGNNGTLSATPPSWQQTGGYNSKGAYSFNGSTNYIDIGSSGSLGLTNELTLTVWVKFDNVSDATRLGNIIGNYPASANFNLEGHFLGKVRFFWSGAPDLFGTKDLRGSWHHVAVVRNATANKTIIYIDGVFDKQDVSGVNRDIQWPLRIGGDFRGEPGLPFQGLIDNIRIYSSALSSSDIQKLYAEEKASHEVAVK